jgi:hypothetical protein
MAGAVMAMAGVSGAPVLFVLEGGYDPVSLKDSVGAVLEEISGPPSVDPDLVAGGAGAARMAHVMNRIVPVHRAYWECWRRYAG